MITILEKLDSNYIMSARLKDFLEMPEIQALFKASDMEAILSAAYTYMVIDDFKDFIKAQGLVPAFIAALKHIPSFMFENDTSCVAIDIPEGTKYIGGYAFSGCTELRRVSIPESVQSINSRSFQDCTKLSTIIIPAGCIFIGDIAFKGCTNLTDVYIMGTRLDFGTNVFSGCKTVKIHVKPDHKFTGSPDTLDFIEAHMVEDL